MLHNMPDGDGGQVADTVEFGHFATIRTLSKKDVHIYSQVLTIDGTHLLTGNHDGTISVWKLVDGSIVHTFEAHRGSVLSMESMAASIWAICLGALPAC